MTKLQRLEIENELMREFREWYNPANISDEDLLANIAAQKDLVKIFEEKYKQDESEEAALVLTSEVMRMVIWEDIYQLRHPETLPIELDT